MRCTYAIRDALVGDDDGKGGWGRRMEQEEVKMQQQSWREQITINLLEDSCREQQQIGRGLVLKAVPMLS